MPATLAEYHKNRRLEQDLEAAGEFKRVVGRYEDEQLVVVIKAKENHEHKRRRLETRYVVYFKFI